MNDLAALAVLIVCVTLVIISAMYFANRQRRESLKTIQKAIETNTELSPELLANIAGPRRRESDFRRAAFLIPVSVIAGLVLLLVGGKAWIFSIIPLFIGLTYLGLSRKSQEG